MIDLDDSGCDDVQTQASAPHFNGRSGRLKLQTPFVWSVKSRLLLSGFQRQVNSAEAQRHHKCEILPHTKSR